MLAERVLLELDKLLVIGEADIAVSAVWARTYRNANLFRQRPRRPDSTSTLM
jgi:hypothetical protein